MLKRSLLAVILLAIFAPSSALAETQSPSPHEAVQQEEDKNLLQELEYKIKTNKAFLKAVEQIVAPSKNEEAIKYMKLARSSAEEGMVHYKSGENKLALEDLSESTQRAIHAITISKNQQDETIREFMIQEEIMIRARQDRERKETMVRKGIPEVEIFIKTAERLFKDHDDKDARAKLAEVKDLYESAKGEVEQGLYDTALEDINQAYKLATGIVKGIKRSQGDIITFPKPALNDEKEVLAYELKKNNAYIFFAAEVIKNGNKVGQKLLEEGRNLKDDAAKAIEAGDRQRAIEKLKASTDVLIKALKSAPVEVKK